jgi:hypothetical protein
MSQMSPALPRSVARWFDPFLTAAVAIAVFVWLKDSTLTNLHLSLILTGAVTLPMLICEWLRARKNILPPDTIDWRTLSNRVAIKWLGVLASLAATLFLWWLLPFYRTPYYQPLFELQLLLLPWWALALIPYLYFSEWRLGEKEDYAWQFGRLVCGRTSGIDWKIARDGALSMLVRTIFLPLNFCFIVENLRLLRSRQWEKILEFLTPESHALIMSAIYAVLIIAIIPGYIFSFRLLNTHTRAIDRSWMGWVVTLSCYPPLLSGIFSQWLAYNPYRFSEPFMKPWIMLFQDYTPLFYSVGIGIIFCELVHYWGESIIGIRSSNLTNRGIITNGPFRLLRHPVYFIKCVGWFLAAWPLIMSDDPLDCLRYTIMFLGVCMIYYLRSIAEERMLSTDPDYVAYAHWMDKHGLLAGLGRRIPMLTFAWRHTHWHHAR